MQVRSSSSDGDGGIWVEVRELPGSKLGSIVWDGALLLCDVLEGVLARARARGQRQQPADPEPGSAPPLVAIEVGAGTGLAGIAAAALGARVLLTDKAAECTELMRANAARNVEAVAEYTEGRGAMDVLELTWGNDADAAEAERWAAGAAATVGGAAGTADLIIASDVLYREDLVAPFISTLVRLSTTNTPPPQILLAYHER